MATYAYTAATVAASANLATDKVRISTTSPVQFVASYPNVSGTGTITTSVSNANVTGSGTTFTTPNTVGYLAPGYWIGNATGATVGIVATVANATFATLTTNGAVAIAGAGYKVNPYGVPYQEANANSQMVPGNTQYNSVYVGQGNVISFINPTGVTANAFTITELGMPHRNSGTTGFAPFL